MTLKLHLEPGQDETHLYEGVEYRPFWEGVERQKLDALEQIVVRDLLGAPARRMVDIGCGFGRLADCYLDRCEQVVMLDSSLSLLHQAREATRGRAALYVAGDAARLPFCAGAFDQVLMVRVFHHLPDSRGVLNELHRLLPVNGRLVFTYSNKANPRRIWEWLRGRYRYDPFRLEPQGEGPVFLMHHPRYVNDLLTEVGFAVRQVRGVGVMDKLAGRAGRFAQRVPLGVGAAPLLGRLALAPWIFLNAQVVKAAWTAHSTDPLEECLQCPHCAGKLQQRSRGYVCRDCLRLYPLEGGILNFLDPK